MELIEKRKQNVYGIEASGTRSTVREKGLLEKYSNWFRWIGEARQRGMIQAERKWTVFEKSI